MKWRLLGQNPAAYVDLPRAPRAETRVLSEDEVARFLTAAALDRFGIVFTSALATGMRPGEYLGLRWVDVDFDRGRTR